jgi:hypothetical protein
MIVKYPCMIIGMLVLTFIMWNFYPGPRTEDGVGKYTGQPALFSCRLEVYKHHLPQGVLLNTVLVTLPESSSDIFTSEVIAGSKSIVGK